MLCSAASILCCIESGQVASHGFLAECLSSYFDVEMLMSEHEKLQGSLMLNSCGIYHKYKPKKCSHQIFGVLSLNPRTERHIEEGLCFEGGVQDLENTIVKHNSSSQNYTYQSVKGFPELSIGSSVQGL